MKTRYEEPPQGSTINCVDFAARIRRKPDPGDIYSVIGQAGGEASSSQPERGSPGGSQRDWKNQDTDEKNEKAEQTAEAGKTSAQRNGKKPEGQSGNNNFVRLQI